MSPDDPLIQLAERTGAFTLAGRVDHIGGTVRHALDPSNFERLKDDTALRVILQGIEHDVQQALPLAWAQEETVAALTDALKLARSYVAKMVADGGVRTTIPPQNALRVINAALAKAEPKAGHDRPHRLPVVAFYGDLPDPDEMPEEVVHRAQGDGRKVFIVGLAPSVVDRLTEDTDVGPLIAIEQALKLAANLPMGDDADETHRPAPPRSMVLEYHYTDGDVGAHPAEREDLLAIRPLWAGFATGPEHTEVPARIVIRPATPDEDDDQPVFGLPNGSDAFFEAEPQVGPGDDLTPEERAKHAAGKSGLHAGGEEE